MSMVRDDRAAIAFGRGAQAMTSVLIVARAIPLHERAGGMEAVSWDLAVGLAKVCSVEVLTTTVPGYDEHFECDGVKVHAIPNTPSGRYSWRWWFKTGLMARGTAPDTVLSISAGATAMAWRRHGHTRFVLQTHGTSLTELSALLRSRHALRVHRVVRCLTWLLIDIATYRRFDRVVCASEHIQSTLRRFPYRWLWRKTRLDLIVNGIPPEEEMSESAVSDGRASLGYSLQDRIVICVARLNRQKGVDLCVDALAVLGPATKLLIVGDGPQRPELVESVRVRGLDKRVSFAGPVSRDEARRLMRISDVFVFAARNAVREGLPLSVLEALGAGLAVVASEDARWPPDLEPMLDRVDTGNPAVLGAAIDRASRVGYDRLPPRFRLDYAIREYSEVLLVDPKRVD